MTNDSDAEGTLYLDSSALVKLVTAEAESEALAHVAGPALLLTSELALAEVPRAIRRSVAAQAERRRREAERELERVLGGVAFVPLDRELLIQAGALEDALLRTLDAIHLAAALSVAAQLGAFVTYDRRQAQAARQAGFTVLAPA